MPKISFLVTYYNQVQFVSKSIESILAINFPKNCTYEILVGDDGSNDGTVNEIKKYIEKYPEIITLFEMPRDKNKKYNSILRASANRLNLLANASGDYFCILDGDDWYCDTEWIKEAISVMKVDNSINVCAFNFQYVYDNIIKKNNNNIPEGKIPTKIYIKRYYTHAGACLIRNTYKCSQLLEFNKIGYFDDNNIVISSVNYGNLYFINKVIYSYRQTGSSLWTSLCFFEQNVINAFDYDINIKYCNNYPEEIKIRYFESLYYVWKNRKKFYSILTPDTAKQYIEMSNCIENSFFRKIVYYDKLPKKQKKEVKNFMKISIYKKINKIILKLYRKISKN